MIRDVGALNLALLVLLVYAAVTLSRQLINAAALASLAWSVPHLIYHVLNTDVLAGSDIALNIGALAVGVGIPILLLMNTSKLEAQTAS